MLIALDYSVLDLQVVEIGMGNIPIVAVCVVGIAEHSPLRRCTKAQTRGTTRDEAPLTAIRGSVHLEVGSVVGHFDP